MNDKVSLNNPIRAAIDECLSGVDALPSLRGEVLSQTRGEKKVKKRLSVGLVLTIVLVLIAVSALAVALLSAREIVEKEVLPMATGNDAGGLNEDFTYEELQKIVKLAEENGIALEGNIKERLEAGQGYYEQETIMALAKSEFGPYPAGWTLEQQYWFEEVMIAIGFKDVNYCCLPKEGDLSYDEAVALALERIKKEKGEDVTDSARWSRLITFCSDLDPDTGAYIPPSYGVEYMAKNTDDRSYRMTISSKGEISDFVVTEPNWRDKWNEDYMAKDFWTADGMYRFYQKWKPMGDELRAAGETLGLDLDFLIRLPIGTPKATDITRDEAYAVARQTALKDERWTEEYLSYYGTREVYLNLDEGAVYHFCFTTWVNGIDNPAREKGEKLQEDGTLPCQYIVRVSAADGTVVSVTENNDMTGTKRLLGIQ